MSTVKEILEQKKFKAVWSIKDEAPVLDAIRLMSLKNIGALIVTNINDELVGLVTERDYARNVILKNRSSRETKVREIMKTNVVTVKEDQSADVCMNLMTNFRIRHLPVMAANGVIGIVSMGDIVKKVINDREFLLDQFIYYIAGTDHIDPRPYYTAHTLLAPPH